MTPLTDDELRDLLTETFAAHERLADPDRAVALASASRPPRRSGRILLAAAAAIAVVAGGTTYALSRGGGPAAETTSPPATTHRPPLPPLQTDAANKAKATAAALAVLARLPGYPGAQHTGPIPAFGDRGSMTASMPGFTISEYRWWRAPGSDAAAVARWYAQHPPRGFSSESGDSVNSSSDGTTTVYGVDLTQPDSGGLPPRGVMIEVQTVRVPGGIGIRAEVLSVWQPARPLASFVQDATSIDVDVTHTRFGRVSHTSHSSFTVRDPAKVLAAEVAFDGLEGTGPIVASCPAMRDSYQDRVVFHTPTGDVTVTTGGFCVDIGTVKRDGKTVGPGLAYVSELLDEVGAAH
ncbi:MAG: hypothetical protein QM747_17620 [Nocardioides sp.]